MPSVHLTQAITRGQWPLHDRATTRALEHAALAELLPHVLMQSAGEAVARLAMALAPHARNIQIACGPGNNGGDGLVAATALHRAGRRVRVLLMRGDSPAPRDAAWALNEAVAAGVCIAGADDAVTRDPHTSRPDLAIDAMLGLGAERPLQGSMAQWAQDVAGGLTLSVDQPSGLNVETGQPWPGGGAVRAQHTLALLTLKAGLFTAQGRDHSGQVWFNNLGLPKADSLAVASLLASVPHSATRQHGSHKGLFGDVAVVGGAAGMTGAAVLAAEAALAAGAGRVVVSPLSGVLDASVRPELMLRPKWWAEDIQLLRQTTVVCGCGGGDAVAAAMPALLTHAPRLVLDADALNAMARDSLIARLQAQRLGRGELSILTPHPLEAARLLNCSTSEVMANRLGAAQALADRHQAVVLLKGSGTVCAAPGRKPMLIASGNGLLASAGTGDVLAGWVGGSWAAASDNSVQTAMQVASRAACLHGHAADAELLARERGRAGLSGSPMRAHELIERMQSL